MFEASECQHVGISLAILLKQLFDVKSSIGQFGGFLGCRRVVACVFGFVVVDVVVIVGAADDPTLENGIFDRWSDFELKAIVIVSR